MTRRSPLTAKLPKTTTEVDAWAAELEVKRLARLRRKQISHTRQKWVAVVMPVTVMIGAFTAYVTGVHNLSDFLMKVLYGIVVGYAVLYVVTLWKTDPRLILPQTQHLRPSKMLLVPLSKRTLL